jgi:ankyrin repeat protein
MTTGGHKDVVELLLNEGAAVNFRNEDGYTALLLASALPFQTLFEEAQKQEEKQTQEEEQSQTADNTRNSSSWHYESDKWPSSSILNRATTTTTTKENETQQQQIYDGKAGGVSEENTIDDVQAEEEFLLSNWNEIATLLLAHNADVNIGDSTGQTPLMMVMYFFWTRNKSNYLHEI